MSSKELAVSGGALSTIQMPGAIQYNSDMLQIHTV